MPVFFNRDPDFAGLYRGLPCWRRGLPGWRRGLPCRHRGLSCWHRGVPGSTVFTPGWRRGLPCWHRVNAGVCRVGTVLTPGSAVFTPGWRSSRRPSTRFFRFHPGRPRYSHRALPRSRRGLPCLVRLEHYLFHHYIISRYCIYLFYLFIY